jgi:histidine ammonia-lyase
MIIAIEWVSAGRALDSRAPLKPAKVTGEWLAKLRTRVAGVGPDRFLAPELQAAVELLS